MVVPRPQTGWERYDLGLETRNTHAKRAANSEALVVLKTILTLIWNTKQFAEHSVICHHHINPSMDMSGSIYDQFVSFSPRVLCLEDSKLAFVVLSYAQVAWVAVLCEILRIAVKYAEEYKCSMHCIQWYPSRSTSTHVNNPVSSMYIALRVFDHLYCTWQTKRSNTGFSYVSTQEQKRNSLRKIRFIKHIQSECDGW